MSHIASLLIRAKTVGNMYSMTVYTYMVRATVSCYHPFIKWSCFSYTHIKYSRRYIVKSPRALNRTHLRWPSVCSSVHRVTSKTLGSACLHEDGGRWGQRWRRPFPVISTFTAQVTFKLAARKERLVEGIRWRLPGGGCLAESWQRGI